MASIIIVDDQPFHREVLGDLVRRQGHEVTAVSGGREALREARVRDFDLAFIDVFLEKQSGLEVARQLGRLAPETPVVLITSSPSLELAVDGLRQGVHDLLVKPLSAEGVEVALGRGLAQRALLTERSALIRRLLAANAALRNLQGYAVAAIGAQQPRVILGKTLRGVVEVTGARGGAVILAGASPLPALVRIGAPGPGSPTEADLHLLGGILTGGRERLNLPGEEAAPAGLSHGGPLLGMAFTVAGERHGAMVVWRCPGEPPFESVEQPLVADVLRTLGTVLDARLRQRRLQESNRRLTRRVTRSTDRLRDIRASLQRLVREVDREKTRSDEALRRLGSIHRIGRELGGYMDIDAQITAMLQLCRETLRARSVSLLLQDSGSGDLFIKQALGLPPEVQARTRIASGEGIAGWVFERNEPLFVLDVEHDPRFRRQSIPQYETSSLVSAPVRSKGRAIGVLNVNNREDGAPFSPEDLELLVFVSHEVGLLLENTSLYEGIQHSYFETIRALVKVLESKDEATKGHSERVTRVSRAMGRALRLSPHSLEVLERASILHDLGKVMVDLSVLRKEGSLTERERQTIRRHPQVAVEILRPMRHLEEVQRCISQHHERLDGHGYPAGTTDLVLEARILAVADAFDAMTSWRPYRRPVPPEEAVAELRRCAGTQFDPEVVETLAGLSDGGELAALGPYPSA